MAPGALSAVWWRLWRAGRNSLRHLVVEEPIRGISVAVVLAVVWMMLGALFMGVLLYLGEDQYAAFKRSLVESLLSLFFFTLFFLVSISDMVLVWGALFRSRAAAFHAQLPFGERALFWSAATEGGLWSSWAVLVLACPLIGALVVDRQHLHPALADGLLMAVGAAAALLAFVICCVAVGGVGALLLARLIPLLRRGLKGIVALAGLALAIGAVVALGALERRGEPTLLVSEIVGHLRFAENPYLPPWWAEQGLSAALDGRWGEWTYYLGLLLSTAASVALVGEWLAGRRLRLDLDALTGRPEARGAGRSRPWRLLPLLPADLALLAAKDLRLFLREPAQVLQFTMFFSILGFYLLMLPRIGKTFLFDEWWRPAVSLLNLTAVAMALATFTGRFVYPLLSLEGRRLWVLALAPWPRARVVTAKFVFALLVGLPAGVVLVVLSGTMLELRPVVVVYQALTIACMAVGFTAGALGLGARLADYTEDNPAKLVAGYGGTINLMSSLAFTGLLLCGAAFPLLSEGRPGFGPWRWGVGLAWTLGITAIWTRIFLGMAWRWFGRVG